MDRNSKENIILWAQNALIGSKLTEVECEKLLKIAIDFANSGYWRGDISERWMSLGYTMSDIPDMYP